MKAKYYWRCPKCKQIGNVVGSSIRGVAYLIIAKHEEQLFRPPYPKCEGEMGDSYSPEIYKMEIIEP